MHPDDDLDREPIGDDPEDGSKGDGEEDSEIQKDDDDDNGNEVTV